MISLTINGQKIEAEEGKKLLEVIKGIGIDIPTLCYHKALSPYGACRLCIVELGLGDESQVVASCLYPAQEGLIVQTHSERVLKTRRIIIELLLARCPDSKELKDLAKELGVTRSRLRPKNEDCTLCGLCVRMCSERMGIGAVGFAGRGSKREVVPAFNMLSEICQTCGACFSICPTGRIKIEEISKNKPIPILSEFDEGLRRRSPIYISYPQAVPNRATIDKDICLHLLKDRCGICEVVCDAKAIDYEQKEEKMELQVGAIILSPGYDTFAARLKEEYGFGVYKNVVTSIQFERILSASGPFGGHIQRLSDGKEPKRIAWIQCVGSREIQTGNRYCSAVCCTYAVKEAIVAKEHIGKELEATIFYMDLRTFGKGFEEYYNRAERECGVRFVRCRVPVIEEDPESNNLFIRYESEEGRFQVEEFEMVVLSVGLCIKAEIRELAAKLGIELDEYGFCKTLELAPLVTNKEGIYVAGAFGAPKDIPETVMQASGAAAKAAGLLAEARGSLITKKEYPPEIDVSGQEPRIGVFVCHCGINIAGVIDIPSVVEYLKGLPNVVYVENNLYTCSQDAQKNLVEKIKEHNLNRVVVASCTPRTHELLFRNTIREAGLNPYLFEMANIRDQCSWVHMNEREKATRKAKDLIRMAVAKSRLLEPLYGKTLRVNHEVLVIGGGVAGMRASLDLAVQGFGVHLVEREAELGGNTRRLHYLLEGSDPQKMLEAMIGQITRSEKIRVYLNTSISKIEGCLGNFKSTLKSNGREIEVEHGAIIVATGAEEYKPTEYLYGQDERVITQLELEEKIFNLQSSIFNLQSIVMIQCVGSREEGRPYCSRLCCSQAIKNALKLKELSPQTSIYILYRDIRTYGLKEVYYQRAQERGIMFIRYNKDQKPEVFKDGDRLKVKVKDMFLDQDLLIDAEMLILSAAIVPNPDNKELAQLLKVPLDQNGFFLEAHIKLRPIDFAAEGIYMAGLAHSPKDLLESISQASGAAGRASTILSKDEIEFEATTSYVVDANCDGCAYCIDPCPYKALTLIEYMKDGAIKKTVDSDETKCKGCGVCMATCPKKGIYVRHFKPEMLSAMVEAALQPIDEVLR